MGPGHYKPITIEDKAIFQDFLRQDPQEISELTFTNLFIWRHNYRPEWLQWKDCLLIILSPKDALPFGLPPVGRGDKREALMALSEHLKDIATEVLINRVPEAFVENDVDPEKFTCILDRANSDYLYLARDLIKLSGRKFHRKKNHLNRFLKNNTFEYRPLDSGLVEYFLEMQESWCRMRECLEHPDLHSEDYAVHEALTHFEELDYQGGAIVIDSRVEAFSLGEALNKETAVIHIEKANPDIPGLYAAINQRFCQNTWAEMVYINREQDLGQEGLRKAKESYNPHHMVNKYTLRPK